MARILRGSGKRSGVGKDPGAPGGIDRRSVLKAGGALGAAAMLTANKAALAQSSGTITPPVLCGIDPPVSPPTTPFRDVLPVPPPAWPVVLSPFPTEAANIAGGEAARANHQRWSQFFPLLHYRMNAAPSLHRHHADLLPSYMWTFNGKYPAPTPLNFYGVPSIVRFKNNLPQGAQNTTFGVPELTVHLHNGHTASESDGFAQDFFLPPLFKDNHYANAYAGIDDFGGIGDPREAMHTFWFHDHRAAFTANNNYLGLNGMYIVYDAKDPGHELATPGSLRLPGYYGITDIPLILTDKRFCAAANGRNEVFQVIGAGAPGGDKWVVNGKIQPRFTVRRRKYRFRVLNTGPAKVWTLTLIRPDGTQAPMTVVAVDANFTTSPFVLADRPLNVQVAMRFDIVIDFAAFPAGTSVYLKEATAQNVGVAVPDPAVGLPIGNVLMRFDVVNRESWFPPDTPAIPGTLIAMPDPIVPDGSFQWDFTLVGGQFLVNGLPFDHNRVDHVVLKGSSEEWTLANDVAAGNWNHPVHIHFEEGRIISRRVRVSQNPDVFQNVPLLPEELGRRDVYPLPPQNRVVLRMRFRDFVGRYLIHCHNMNHEDDFMMARWDIVETVEELARRRLEIDQRRMLAGLPPQYKHGGLV
ncbi:MAG TPA: multicopper oxidase family protein [Steroidobacteraceae bacterium]|nr:multicopper oxidase family protein [Steroidobacteraceae bacterium]